MKFSNLDRRKILGICQKVSNLETTEKAVERQVRNIASGAVIIAKHRNHDSYGSNDKSPITGLVREVVSKLPHKRTKSARQMPGWKSSFSHRQGIRC